MRRATFAGVLAAGPAVLDDDACVAAWAASGAMYLTGPASGPPSVSPAGIVRPLIGLGDALASATGRLGTAVEVDAVGLTAQRAAFTGFGRGGSRSAGGYAQMVRARDGWLALNLPRPSDAEALPALVGTPVDAGDQFPGHASTPNPSLALVSAPGDAGNWPEIEERLAAMARSEVVEAASLLGLAVAAVGETPRPDAPWTSHRDVRVRRRGRADWPRSGGDPAIGGARPPARAARERSEDEWETRPERPVSAANEGGEDKAAPRDVRDLFALTQSGSAPVVVDLTSLWAGPLAGGLLAEAGCRVLKVESISRPDGARRGPAGFFELLNGRKERVCLDLPAPDAVSRLRELIAGADLVLEASRPRVMQQWGICPDEVVEAGTAWVSITGHGRRGPHSNRVAFGDDAAASGGLVVAGESPMFVGDAIADPIAGLVAAAIGAHLLAEGHAAVVDVSLASVSAWVRAHAGDPIDRPVTARGGCWQVELADGPVTVRRPAAPDRLTTPTMVAT